MGAEWPGQLPTVNTCQPSDILILQAAAPMPLHPPGSRFFVHPSGTE